MSNRFAVLTVLGALALATPLSAQSKAEAPNIVGTWTGTAKVPLGDSTLTVPVSYTFIQSGKNVAGTAMVPGQGQGVIANVVREGSRIRFRVTVTPATVASSAAGSSAGVTVKQDKLLEHDGTFGADGAIEGMVNLDSKPIASFRIAPVKTVPAK